MVCETYFTTWGPRVPCFVNDNFIKLKIINKEIHDLNLSSQLRIKSVQYWKAFLTLLGVAFTASERI